MSQQLRELIKNSMEHYRDFFRRFRLQEDQYPVADELVHISGQKMLDNPIFPVFLKERLEVKKDDPYSKVDFEHPLSRMKKEILEVLKSMLDVSKDFPRASKQKLLWRIDNDDPS